MYLTMGFGTSSLILFIVYAFFGVKDSPQNKKTIISSSQCYEDLLTNDSSISQISQHLKPEDWKNATQGISCFYYKQSLSASTLLETKKCINTQETLPQEELDNTRKKVVLSFDQDGHRILTGFDRTNTPRFLESWYLRF